ncbi:hypothetical protein BZG05_05695 [Salinivibrio kushneri]|nr:hypothetical protein BZG05_05695 [Salinivibrio kushneri]
MPQRKVEVYGQFTRRARQQQDIAAAKQAGKYKGRQPDIERHQKVHRYREMGMSLKEVATVEIKIF